MVADNGGHRLHPHPLVGGFGWIEKPGCSVGRIRTVKRVLDSARCALTGGQIDPTVFYRRVLVETSPDLQDHAAHRVRVAAVFDPVQYCSRNEMCIRDRILPE